MWAIINISLSVTFFISSALIWDHYLPWTAFSNEFFACLGLLFLVISISNFVLKIPFVALPLLLISLIPMGEYLIGFVHFFSNAFLSFSYIFMGFLSVMVGFTFAKSSNSQKFYIYFCFTAIFIGIASSLFAIIQWLKLEHYFNFIFELQGSRPYANFAQPNNLATALLLSWLACIYLYEEKIINIKAYYCSVILILFGVALSQSRTSWLVIPIISCYLFYKGYIRTNITIHYFIPIVFYILSICILPSLRKNLGQLFDLTPLHISTIAERASSGYQRLDMWKQTLEMIAIHPLVGSGWNQSIWSEVDLLLKRPIQVEGYYYSSHNILLDLWVWNGIIIGTAIILYFVFWLFKIFQSVKKKSHILALAMLGVILIHALLEYPLYYANFLIPSGLLLGFVTNAIPKQKFIQFSRWFSYPFLIIYISLIYIIWQDYNRAIEQNTSAQLYDLMRTLKKIPQYGVMNDYKLEKNIYILDQLKYDSQWLALNPFVAADSNEFELYKQVTIYRPVPSKLIKLAQLALYNHNEEGYTFSEKLLKNMYRINVTKQELMQNNLLSIAEHSQQRQGEP